MKNTMHRGLIALGLAAALPACLPEFPADPPAPPPDMQISDSGDDTGAEPEPEPEPDTGPPIDMATPEPDLGPQPETCDGTDEDLDRRIDEGFVLNQPCTTDDDRCGLTGCAADGTDTACTAAADAPMRGDERCNTLDDDCDGDTDEGFDVAAVCMIGTGACQTFGLQTCAPDGMSTECDAMPIEPLPELCNEIDDDCDGDTDEDGACDE